MKETQSMGQTLVMLLRLQLSILAYGPVTSYFLGLASAQTVTLTSSVEQDGRQAACPGEVVTFTCMVTEATMLRWIAEPFIPQSDPIDFVSLSTAGEMAVDDSNQFRAVLDSIMLIGDGSGLFRFGSRLTVTASGIGSLSGTEIQCSGRQFFSPTSVMMSKTLIIAGTYNALYRRNYAKTNPNNFHPPPPPPPPPQPFPLLPSNQGTLFHSTN